MNALNAITLPTIPDPPNGVRVGRRERRDLIPDPLRRSVDAIVIETAWPQLADEVARVRDYHRLHQVAAALRVRQPFRSTRSDCDSTRAAEAALVEHQRRVRAASYVPLAANLFRVH